MTMCRFRVRWPYSVSNIKSKGYDFVTAHQVQLLTLIWGLPDGMEQIVEFEVEVAAADNSRTLCSALKLQGFLRWPPAVKGPCHAENDRSHIL